MKIRLLAGISLFLFVFINNMNAQSFGFKAGVQFSEMTGLPLSSNYLTSFQGKAAGIVKVNKSISLTPSLGYSGKGYVFGVLVLTDQSGNEIGLGKSNTRFNYLQLTVPVSYRIALKKENAIYLGAGPYFAYALSTKGKLNNSNASTDPNTWKLVTAEGFKKTDAGLAIQIDATLKKRFLVSLNIDFGLINVAELYGNEIKSKAAGISIGYLFHK